MPRYSRKGSRGATPVPISRNHNKDRGALLILADVDVGGFDLPESYLRFVTEDTWRVLPTQRLNSRTRNLPKNFWSASQRLG